MSAINSSNKKSVSCGPPQASGWNCTEKCRLVEISDTLTSAVIGIYIKHLLLHPQGVNRSLLHIHGSVMLCKLFPVSVFSAGWFAPL